MKTFSLFFKSIFIGVGAIAPGLSGGALAMIFGIYERLVSSVSNLFTKFRENLGFLITVGSGAVLGLVLFAGVQRYLLEHYQLQTLYVFAGLLIGTLPGLFKEGNKFGFDKKYLSGFVITLGLGVFLSLLGKNEMNVEAKELILNYQTVFYLFLAGLVLAGSLVIPGISGTVLLMLLGAYGIFINAVADVKEIVFVFQSKEMFWQVFNNLLLLVPLVLGLLLGAIMYAKLMNYLLKNHYGFTYYCVLGFVIGSLFELIPGISFNRTGTLSLILGLIALILSLQLNRLFGHQSS